jgi:DNA-binding NarL/FixJ family response regulator
MPAEDLRVLYVEDHRVLSKLVRNGLVRRGCSVTTANSLASAQAAIEERSFDVAILDLVLPDGRSETLIPALKRQKSNPAIIVLSGHVDARTAVDLNDDVDLTVPKPAELQTVLEAVDAVTGNERLRRVVHGYCEHVGLSPREEEVLSGAVRGLSNGEIADEVGVSEGTIRTYWSRIVRKAGEESQRDAITAVLRFRFSA